MEEDLKQNQKVHFKVQLDFEGTGKICGVSQNGVAILGKSYIIELDVPINPDFYPYSHITIAECFLSKIDE